jgi:Mlc titration factor MtfA (ptsG expression regulator)
MSIWDTLAQHGRTLVEHAAQRLQFQLPAEPVPPHWSEIVARNVPLAQQLAAAEQDRLLRVARLLLDEVPFEGCDGFEITDEVRVTIAATAALLVHRLPYPRFTKLVRVLVYPDAFLPVQIRSRHDLMVAEPEGTLGQAWMSGVVVVSWAAVRAETAQPAADSNVVLHEMAHILDAEDGIFDGQPLLDEPSQGRAWAVTLERDFAVQRDAMESGAEPPLDDYAARNRAEFFAVAIEAFFCRPERLRDRLPDLYSQLSRFFRQDLAANPRPM